MGQKPSKKAFPKSSKNTSKPTKDLKALAFPTQLMENEIIKELRQTVQKLLVFDSLGKTLTSSLDLSEILRIVVEKLGSLVECKYFALVLLDDDSNEFYFEFPKELAELKSAFSLGRGILGRSLERGRGELSQDPSKDPVFDPELDGLVVTDPSSIITLPIMSKGSVLGLLAFFRDEKEPPFTTEQFRYLETFSDYLAIAVENARNYRHVQELTISDDLTKLYNSRYLHLVLEREIASCERYREDVSVVFIDLDNFKNVNDQFGHMSGSQLLKEFGEFLLSTIRLSDVAIRYGGDEFVLVLPRTAKKEAVLLVNRARENLHSHVFLKAKHLNIKMTASFGVASFVEDGKTIDELITAADRAMYIVKKGSKDGVYASTKPITLMGSKF
jgi:diguanylate cyclase (GGDEF)-like protein